MSRFALDDHQAQRLRELLTDFVPRIPFWRRRLDEAGIDPAHISHPSDLTRLPFTQKSELLADQQACPPYGTILSESIPRYSRLHQTSGTTGAPLRWLDTPESWDNLLRAWRQMFALAGVGPDDRLFFPFSFGPFLGFWSAFEAASRRGWFCLPAGGLSSAARLHYLLDNRMTVVCCTPTYALRLAEVAAEHGIDLRGSGVRAVLVAGEPGGSIPVTRARIAELWGARVIDHWGMTEVGPLAIEPHSRSGGLCMLETECIAEIVDPETGRPVGPGTEGELVITTLGRIHSPLLRYRTGDRVCAGQALLVPASWLHLNGDGFQSSGTGRQGTEAADSRAGRDPGPSRDMATSLETEVSLTWLEGGILGRVDEMITIRGNNLYPAALENLIREFPQVAEFRIELRRLRSMPHLKIVIEPAPEAAEGGQPDKLASEIASVIKSRWNFQAEVVSTLVGSLPRFEMKARRFVRIEPGEPAT